MKPVFVERRLEILRELGWGEATLEEYYAMLRILSRRCTQQGLMDFLGWSKTALRADLRRAGAKARPVQRPPKLYAGRPLTEWAQELKISINTLHSRLYRKGDIFLGD